MHCGSLVVTQQKVATYIGELTIWILLLRLFQNFSVHVLAPMQAPMQAASPPTVRRLDNIQQSHSVLPQLLLLLTLAHTRPTVATAWRRTSCSTCMQTCSQYLPKHKHSCFCCLCNTQTHLRHSMAGCLAQHHQHQHQQTEALCWFQRPEQHPSLDHMLHNPISAHTHNTPCHNIASMPWHWSRARALSGLGGRGPGRGEGGQLGELEANCFKFGLCHQS
jgi:hypothetical protein